MGGWPGTHEPFDIEVAGASQAGEVPPPSGPPSAPPSGTSIFKQIPAASPASDSATPKAATGSSSHTPAPQSLLAQQ